MAKKHSNQYSRELQTRAFALGLRLADYQGVNSVTLPWALLALEHICEACRRTGDNMGVTVMVNPETLEPVGFVSAYLLPVNEN